MNDGCATAELLDSQLLLFEEWQQMKSGENEFTWEGFIYYKRDKDAIKHLDIYDDYIDAYISKDNWIIYRSYP